MIRALFLTAWQHDRTALLIPVILPAFVFWLGLMMEIVG
jgi:hypothetical protein